MGQSGRLTIIVPIHNARGPTEACVASLLRHNLQEARVLLLDDASTDALLWPMLDKLAEQHPQLQLHRNERRLGYTATINLGCSLAGRDDVVLLNSDTEVTHRWLEKLRAVAASRPDVATVTPLSNAAGPFSIPHRGRVNRLPAGIGIDGFGALVEERSARLYPEVPTGHGFCLLVRRAALDAVGAFDAETFPRGCGEENDFCMRAREAGFVHLIDDATFVYHIGSASLRWRKRWLVWRAQRKLSQRYPEYVDLVAEWLRADPLRPMRRRLRRALDQSGPEIGRQRA